MKIAPEKTGLKALYAERGIAVQERPEFLADLRSAIRARTGYAAGRFGISEEFWMYYPVLLSRKPDRTLLRVFERHLRHHCVQQGLFPALPDFFLEYARFYVDRARSIDSLGLILDAALGPEIIEFHGLANKFIFFKDQLFDKSSPTDPADCYLDELRGKRILLVCPFAGLLKDRANRETFEGVWRKTGRRWFFPQSVEALEIPYAFAHETHHRFATTFQLLKAIETEVGSRDFDVALIAAGGLSIPLDARVKAMGRVGLSLGGDLQVLFGVIGRRWRGLERWRRDYFNEFWIDMPEAYRPRESGYCDGAYW
jgi:hypothetical protein